jgi:hypothetical protein
MKPINIITKQNIDDIINHCKLYFWRSEIDITINIKSNIKSYVLDHKLSDIHIKQFLSKHPEYLEYFI